MAPQMKIELAGVSKRYGKHIVLEDVSLGIEAGSFVALVGPSGAGKTTLLKVINGLVTPDAGSVAIDGRDIREGSATELRREIGYVIQEVGLFPHMTVAENIWLVPSLKGTPGEGRQARVAELLELVSLDADLALRHPRALSGGQAQRVGFARALAARPSIMLMDEPFGALDPVTRDELGRVYRDLHARLGLTSIMVTHDVSEALLLSDRVIVIDGGRVRADMSPAQLLAETGDDAIRAMIDVPRSQAERLLALQQTA